MDELNKEYTLLFNGITDAIQQLEVLTQRLKRLQTRAEEAFLDENTSEQEEKIVEAPVAEKGEKEEE